MGLRKDLLDRIPAGDAPDTSDWVSGRFFTLSLRAGSETIAVGVALKIWHPEPDVLYHVASLDALSAQYGPATLKQWQALIERALRRIDHGNIVSPAPGVVQYSAFKPFRYPSREAALDRLYRRHVNLLLRADEKAGEEGGVLTLASSRTNPVLAEVQRRCSLIMAGALIAEERDGMTTLSKDGKTLGMFEIAPEQAATQIKRAGLRLVKSRHDGGHVTLLAISEQAEELSKQLAEQIDLIRQHAGVEIQIRDHEQSTQRVTEWLRAVND